MKAIYLLIALFLTINTPFAKVNHQTKFLKTLSSGKDFNAISLAPGGFIKLGRTIKVLVDDRVKEKPNVYFLNANYCNKDKCRRTPKEAVFHYHFGKKYLNFKMSLDNFSKQAYYTSSIKKRNFYAARIQSFQLDSDSGIKNYLIVRFIERDLIHEEMIKRVMSILRKRINISDYSLAFVSNSDKQTTISIKDWLKEKKIEVFKMNELVKSVNYMPLNQGVTFGILKVNPKDPTDLSPFEIALFDQLPIDLAVVAGTITTVFQDVGSHVNLKAKERNTPNMVIRKQEKIDFLKSFDGMPIRLSVNSNNFQVEQSTKEKVMEFYKNKLNKPWKKASYKETSKLDFFEEICPSRISAKKCLEKANQYGGKVAGLGFLSRRDVVGMGSSLQKKYGYRLTPMGFGVPLSFYHQFILYNKKINPVFSTDLNALLQGDKAGSLSISKRKEIIKKIQDHFMQGKLPPQMYERVYQKALALKKEIESFYKVDFDKIKIRSSANVEDIDNFNGAGLHDSYSAKISKSHPSTIGNKRCRFKIKRNGVQTKKKVSPKSLSCAIKAVYASLWNLRAVSERSYRRFDHFSASMGLSIQPSYSFRENDGKEIIANTVLITRVIGTSNIYGYQISSQKNNGLVTNPSPETQAELATMTFQTSNFNPERTIIHKAKPLADGPPLEGPVMSFKLMKDQVIIAKTVEEAYCKANNKTYFPNTSGGVRSCKYIGNSVKKPAALDMEFKIYSGNEVLIKQVRKFHGK